MLCTVPFCVQAHNVTLHNTSLRDICPRENQRCVWHSHVKAGVARINILLLAMLRIRYPRFGFTVRVLSYYRYLEEIEKNILQRCIFICRLKKMLYLCTRNQEITSECKGSGALVQLVRIRACHARGQGFESPTHRTKEDNRKVVFFFCVYLRGQC